MRCRRPAANKEKCPAGRAAEDRKPRADTTRTPSSVSSPTSLVLGHALRRVTNLRRTAPYSLTPTCDQSQRVRPRGRGCLSTSRVIHTSGYVNEKSRLSQPLWPRRTSRDKSIGPRPGLVEPEGAPGRDTALGPAAAHPARETGEPSWSGHPDWPPSLRGPVDRAGGFCYKNGGGSQFAAVVIQARSRSNSVTVARGSWAGPTRTFRERPGLLDGQAGCAARAARVCLPGRRRGARRVLPCRVSVLGR